ncbi:MAG TPA: MFS transporter [Solirubrobacteraceae bacterium]
MKILRPLRERDFALLWGGLTVSLIGDGIYLVAVAWQVYDLSNVPSALAIVGLAWSAGMALFLLTGGVVSDRMERRRVMIGADLVRAGALGVLGVLAITGSLELWQLIALVVVYAAGEAFFGPALGALVPDILSGEHLVEANSLELTVRQICRLMIGPAIGGILVASVGAGNAFLADAGTFLVSALMITLIRTRSIGSAGSGTSIRQEVLAGLRYVRSERFIWVTLLASSLAMLMFFGPLEVLLPYVVRNEVGGGAGGYGIVLAADGAGAVAAALVMSQRARLPGHYLTVMFLTWAAATLPLAGYAAATAIWQLMVLSVIYGALMTIGLVIWGTLMQTRVPGAMRGRVHSVEWFTSIGLVPLSFALTGPVSSVLGVDTTLIIAGVAPAISTLLLFVVFRMRREERPLSDAGAPLDAVVPVGGAGAVAELEVLPEAARR